jgi:flagellar operon protein
VSQRNIVLTDQEIRQIDSAIDKADAKGIKDALILMDNKAFVANIKNKTIITATTNEQLKDSVFTKIDGAVII